MLSILVYAALLIFTVGLVRKIVIYVRTPQRLNVPTMPAPRTRFGVFVRMLREIVFFESLFKSSVWTWIFAWFFHAGMVFTLIVHLRYLTDPTWAWVAALIPFNKIASACMAIGIIGLLIRRCAVDRVRAISAPSDYLMLVFFLGIPVTGIAMRLLTNTDYSAVTQFAQGIVQLTPKAMSGHTILFLHIAIVCIVLVIFPFSKLLHAPGMFFSPSRNQSDNTRKPMSVEPGKQHGE